MIKLKHILKMSIKNVLLRALNRIRTDPKLRLFVKKAVCTLGLEPVACSLLGRLRVGDYKPTTGLMDEAHLSPRARRIYLDLKQTIAAMQRERN